uniref:Uncharacterized protein n=1 Tax=Anguilla anguilla TaxID=7936 RepID=A0A0E9T1W5_ANGAN
MSGTNSQVSWNVHIIIQNIITLE